MAKIRLTKEFRFEMAHALWNYDGRCKNVHGHSYKLFVTVIGTPVNDLSDPKHGMVMDFGLLKRIVNQQIVDKFDHSFVVNECSPLPDLSKVEQLFDRLVKVNFQPTTENLLIDFAHCIQKELPEEVKLHHLKLYETAASFAEWYAEDNP